MIPHDARTPSQDFGVQYWIKKGAIPAKFILGMGTYGKTFKIADDASGKGVGVSASGSGTSGKYTREGGFLSYYEVSGAPMKTSLSFAPCLKLILFTTFFMGKR